jgi:hypothetical protein
MLLSIRYRQRGSHYRVKKEKKKKNFFSTNDSRFRDKEVEKATSTELQATTTRAQSITERINEKSEEMQIVGIAEPIGMWTKFVTLQKLSWLKAMVGSKAESEKFWQNMIVAQQKAQSKQKGRTGPGS